MADRVLKNVSVGSSLCDIVIKSGRIAIVGKSGLPGEDMGGLKAFAGLIDIHTHGALGHDVTSGGHLEELSDYQSSQGVTAWFPTTTTASPAASRNARMRGSRSWRATGEVGSGVAGGMALSMRATRSSPVEEASDAPSEISGSLILR